VCPLHHIKVYTSSYPHTVAVRRSVRMQCHKISSSSSDDDSEKKHAAAAPGECAPCTTLKCTLPHTVAVRRRTARAQISSDGKIGDDNVRPRQKPKHINSISSSSDQVSAAAGNASHQKPRVAKVHAEIVDLASDVSFDAADVAAAKDEVLRIFGTSHSNGRVRCINSRANYAYCQCSKCGCTLAVKQSKVNPKKWVISAVSEKARQPCLGSASVTPLVPPHTAVEAPLPAPPILSIQPSAECSICADSCLRQDLFECPSAAHLLCQACFENNVTSQIREDLVKFLARDCSIVCGFCALTASIAKDKKEPVLSFNMQQLVSR
jgi:hypothetical protein